MALYASNDRAWRFWDQARALYVSVCERCCEGLDTPRPDQADDWAPSHHCDPELAALLADITTRRAA